MNAPINFLSGLYNINISSRLLEMVKNPNARLEDVLDEDAVVQEYRDNKPSVVD